MADVSVKVAVRIRPLLPKEVLHGHRACVRVVPGSSQVMLGTDQNKTFSFHYAFGPECGQDAVYAECVRPLVDALLQGYNATVFCYGQTGSGKTHTLEGGSVAEDGGLIDRVAHDLFALLDERSEVAEYTVNLSYLELYLEELRDLLDLPTVHKDLHIREDDRGNTVIVGATETPVTSAEELLSILETGNTLRHTRSTAMNDQSSRSHAILTLHLHQRIHDPETSVRSVCSSKLRLVDLAGSERAHKTGNTGPRLKESVHINTGLLALGNVIRALTNPKQIRNAKHIPYRDAKLTRLLRDSLGGQAHTLMVACVSPSDRSMTETLHVLQFASRARHIRNRPVLSANADGTGATTQWDPMEAKVDELEFQVQTLTELLKDKQSELEKERDKNKAVDGEGNYNQDAHEAVNKMPRYFDLAKKAGALLAEVAPSIADSLFKRKLEKWQENFRMKRIMCQTREDNEIEEQMPCEDALELRKVKEALEIAEEMMQENEAEVRRLQQKIEKANKECKAHMKELEEQHEQNQIKTEQLVNQQIVIDRLRGVKSTVLGTRESSASVRSERRAQSVPLQRQNSAAQPLRKIHSSPPVFSLERVRAAFKMRGLLLLDAMDRKQKVYSPFIKQKNQESSPNKEEEEEEEEFQSKMGFRRSLNRTWTSRQKKLIGPKQDGADEAMGDQQTKPHLHNTVRSSVKRRIHDLSSIIRMKEELIQEMDKTDKLSQAVDKQGSRSLDGRDARGVLAKLSLQNQQIRAQTFHSLQHMRQQRAALQACSAQEGQETEPCEAQASAHRRNNEESSKKEGVFGNWLEEVEEQVLQRRAEQKVLEEEQKRRAEIQERREACLQQRNRLQDKRLHSSQVLSQDLLHMSVQLDNLEEQIESSNMGRAEGVSVEELKKERDGLQQRRDALEQQLQDNHVLTQEEEHCLLELEEALETLDAALEFKTQCIQRQQSSSHSWTQRDDTHLRTVRRRLRELSPPEITELLIRYFNKVVSLREAERALLWRCEELELQTSEQDAALRAMEGNMQRLALDTDRRLMQQHRENQSHIQLLLRELREIASNGEQREMQDRLQHLEKELFFYKSSSRNLKKQLRELSASLPSAHHVSNPQTDKETHTNGSEATTHIPTTYTRINSMTTTTMTTHSQTSFSLQNSSTSASYHLTENKNNSSLDNHTSLRCLFDSAQSYRSGEKLTPVRVHRRDLRQVSLSRLQASQLSSRGQQSIVETSSETTVLEDSIEVSRIK